MPTVQRATGVEVTFPETMAVSDERPPRGQTRAFRKFAPPEVPAPMIDDLLSALAAAEMELMDTVPLHTLEEPTSSSGRRSRSAARVPASQEVSFLAPVEEGQAAVAIVEQDGLYSWSMGTFETQETDDSLRSAPGTETPTIAMRFSVTLYSSSYSERRNRLFGMERIFRPIKAFIFKIPANFVVGQVVKRLEKKIDTGLIHFTGAGVNAWKPLREPGGLELPKDRPARILLMIHGTFSSTIGGFGALGATAFGKAFVTDALASYDAVLGFDHRTLSVDPLDNAEELMTELRKLKTKHSISFDAVAHSRGGLVIRSLIEHLQPGSGWDASFKRTVFVGSTNAGTELANRDNWHRLIDLYTNLAVGSMNALSKVAPQTQAVAKILTGLLKGLAAFVKAIAVAAIDENQALGLAAMSPQGNFVSQINQTQPGQPDPDSLDCFAITSDFEATLADEGSLPAKLLRVLGDGVVDQLMGESNDLVVDVDSMTTIDPRAGGFVKDALEYGENGQVHHVNYFHHEASVKALTRWLHLADPTALVLGGVPEADGGMVEAPLPAYVDDDMVVVPATATGREVKSLLKMIRSEWVVVRRPEQHADIVHHYAYRPVEIKPHLRANKDLTTVLGLGEHLRSDETSPSMVTGFDQDPFSATSPTTGRTVVLSGGSPIGVVPNHSEMRTVWLNALETTAPPVPRSTNLEAIILGGGSMRSPRTRSWPKEVASPRRTATRRSTSVTPEIELPEPEKLRHYFRADMPQQVVIEEPTAVEVTVSLEALEAAAGRAAGADAGDVDRSRKILINVRPRSGFESLGDTMLELEPLEPGADEMSFFFDVRATDLGPGRIDVVVRQGQVPMLTLKLEPEVVATEITGTRRIASSEARVTDAPALDSPIDELTIWEEKSRGETRLRFSLRAESLNERATASSKDLGTDVEDYVAGIYKDIETRWSARTHTSETFTKDLRAIGMTMYEELVPREIRDLLWDNRDKITNIQVMSEEPHIPWEIVHLKGPRSAKGGKFLGEMGLVRWLEGIRDNGFGPTEVKVDTAKAIIPEYPAGTDWVLKEPPKEFAYVEKVFQATKIESNRIDVDEALETPGSFDLLHFAGHGEAPTQESIDAALILKVTAGDGQWETEELNADTVLHYGNIAHGDTRPMVVLNACQVGRVRDRLGGTGGFAKAFLTSGAGIFVSSLWAVGDEPARTFVESLYQNLVEDNKTISEATVLAREAAKESGDLTWLAYTVYAHPHARVQVV